MKKNNVITFRVCEKTQKMMDEELDWCKREKTPPYAKWQAKDGDTVITLYESGKVVFQGSDADLASDFWITTERINSGKVDVKNSATNKSDKLDKTIKVDPKIYNSSSIGSDEVGTGDYFGPIVVTAAFVSKDNIPYLEELGVKDSKQMSDDKILEVVPKIIKKIPYESMILTNTEYNQKYSKDLNLNKIKAIMHNNVLYKLREKTQSYDYIIVDEFAKDFIYYNYLRNSVNVVKNITFLTKGESKSLAVAAASLISRYIFIKEFNKLSDQLDIILPKGASEIVDEVAFNIAKDKGIDYLNSIAKMNFKNTLKVEEMLKNR